jgi:hypothetical protein
MREDLKRSLLKLASGKSSAHDLLADASASFAANGLSVTAEMRELARIHDSHQGCGPERASANANRDLLRLDATCPCLGFLASLFRPGTLLL